MKKSASRAQWTKRWFPIPEFLQMSAAGINISNHAVRVIELGSLDEKKRIRACAEYILEDGIVENGHIQDAETLLETLKEVRKEVRTPFVRTSIPEEKAYIFDIKLPRIDEEDVAESIRYQLPEYAPLSADEAVADHRIFEVTDEHILARVTATSRLIIEEYTSLFQRAGFHIVGIDVEAIATARAVVPQNKETYLILDVGKTRTGVAISENNIVRYTSSILFGGDRLTKVVQQYMGGDTKDAESDKQAAGFDKNKQNAARYGALVKETAKFVEEIQQHIHYWETHTQADGSEGKQISHIILTGGSATLPNFAEYLAGEKATGLPTTVADVWTNTQLSPGEKEPVPNNIAQGYAAAVGLALSSKV